ncbi:phosphomannomutase/phosphoglucomutase [Candidatus Babeliales bacterium]|nr:phosphomannomutase/phosphoglucomutase [Candidatus Babeliales bacterium]
MKNQIFREYDIRGIVGKEIDIEETYNLSKAIITYYKQKNPQTQTIIVGRDGRNHSLQIQKNTIRAIIDLGLDVIDIGLCTTPAFYFSLHNLPSSTGMIITASHNPGEYNGIKICLDKKSIWGIQIQEIKKIYQSKNFYQSKNVKKGSVKTYDITSDYIDFLANHFKHLKNLKIDAIIDCGNGTGGTVFPHLIKKMNFKNVKLIFEEVDGNFPNHEADPTVQENMKYLALELKNNPEIKLGIGLDGDCDRMNPMTKKGKLVPGDQLLAVYAQQILKDHPNAAVAFDIKASSSLIELLRSWKAKDCISPSGHSLIKKTMSQNNAILAGELSCHFFFKDRYFGYDDGIYAALRLLEIIHQTQKNLEELIKIFPEKQRSKEIRIKCSEENKKEIVEHVKNIFTAKKNVQTITIDGIRAQMDYGWGLARVSNTQPVICLRFESKSKEGLKKIKNDFYDALKPYFEEKFLKEQIEL